MTHGSRDALLALLGIGVLMSLTTPSRPLPWPSFESELEAEVPPTEADRYAFLAYLRRWIASESAGNPCATGLPQEGGIFQVYFDKPRKYGASLAELRAGCAGNKLVQLLTPSQRRLQVSSGVAMVREALQLVADELRRLQLSWNAVDRRTLAKLYFGLPAFIYWLRIAAREGNASSWDAFRQWATPSLETADAARVVDERAGLAVGHGAAPFWPLERFFRGAQLVGRGA